MMISDMRLWLTVYLAIACALQWAIGNMDVRLFSFPIGAALGGSLVAILYVVYSEWGKQQWMRQIRSAKMSCWLLGLTAVACIVGGCMTADSAFQTSIPFVALLIALMVNLTIAILHRLHSGKARKDWIFLTTHFGIWLMLFSGLAGAGDNRQLRSVAGKNQATTAAIDTDNRMVSLPYSLQLKDFRIETNTADGSPTQYAATILIDDQPIDIAVNCPHPLGFSEDLYLMSFYRRSDDLFCVLMVERQPWKHPMLAGICLLLLGAVAGGCARGKAFYARNIK